MDGQLKTDTWRDRERGNPWGLSFIRGKVVQQLYSGRETQEQTRDDVVGRQHVRWH